MGKQHQKTKHITYMNAFITVDKPKTKESTLWVEKYRPKQLNDYIGNENVKDKIAEHIRTEDPPHLLFYGKAGTGKTTLAKIITGNIPCDEMYINASDENSVDTIRNRVKQFASSVSMSGLKIVVLDEFDYMTPNAQAALRNLMETFEATTRFILTCNYYDKIISPIISRVQHYNIVPPTKTDVASHSVEILKNEDVAFEKKDLATIINKYYPDIRKVINVLQQSVTTAEDGSKSLSVDTKSLVENDVRFKLLERLQRDYDSPGRKLRDIRVLVAHANVADYNEIYRFLYENIDEYAPDNYAEVTIRLSEAQHRDSLVVDHEINFMHCMIEILNIIE